MIEKVKILLEKCVDQNLEISLDALQDLGYLIEKNILLNIKLSDYEYLFYDSDLLNLTLEPEELEYLKVYLFFMILNNADRSSKIAWCLGKLHDKSMVEGICQLIEFFLKKNDETVFYLVKAITDVFDFKELSERVLNLLDDINVSDLPISNNFVTEQLLYYKNIYGYKS